ncbi:unnamed protein product [Pleuronectes platessa]|uniref:Uncharacterized protein n=1 Tax=Pleuronectes platessa TaxID=8262 RepID=A0A9N7TTT4_PLEPL|nr:unnamed protein product [Pleuronectes platessa]
MRGAGGVPSGGGRVRSLVLVMMLETLWPPGRRKNNGMGYFYGGAKQWVTSRWDAGARADAPLPAPVPPRQPLPLPQRRRENGAGGRVDERVGGG